MFGNQQNQKRKPVSIFCVVTTLVTYQLLIRFNKVHNTFLFSLLTVILVVTLPEPFKAYEKWIQTELGDAIRVAKMATSTKPEFVTRNPDTDPYPSPEC
jgi:hypothetical protein